MALEIRKKGTKNFFHYPSQAGAKDFSLSKLLAKVDGDDLVLVEPNGAKRGSWNYSEVSIYDDTSGGSEENYPSAILLFQRLIDLGYPAFIKDGEVVVAELISTDPSNIIVLGTDGLLYAASGGVVIGDLISTDTGNTISLGSDGKLFSPLPFEDQLTGRVATADSTSDVGADYNVDVVGWSVLPLKLRSDVDIYFPSPGASNSYVRNMLIWSENLTEELSIVADTDQKIVIVGEYDISVFNEITIIAYTQSSLAPDTWIIIYINKETV